MDGALQKPRAMTRVFPNDVVIHRLDAQSASPGTAGAIRASPVAKAFGTGPAVNSSARQQGDQLCSVTAFPHGTVNTPALRELTRTSG